MATIRQLTTRFNFETDTQGVQNFRNTMSGMKKTILGVFAAGAGAAVVAGKFGVGLEEAAVSASRLTDEISLLEGTVKLTGDLADSFDQVKESIPGRVNLASFLRSFTSFKLLLKEQPLADFNTLFETAGRIAVIQGGNIEDSFDKIIKAATSGQFQPLQEIFPGFDLLDKNMQGFIQRLLEVDPTNVNNVRISLDRFLEIVRENESELADFAKTVNEATAVGQLRELGRNMKEVGAILGLNLAKPMREALKVVNEYFDLWIKGSKTLPQILAGISKTITSKLGTNPIIRPILQLAKRFGLTEEVPDRLDVPVQARGKAEKPRRQQLGIGLTQQFEDVKEAIQRRKGEGTFIKEFQELRMGIFKDIIKTLGLELERGGHGQPIDKSIKTIEGDRRVSNVNTFNITISGAQSPRAVIEELQRLVGQASASFTPIEGVS